MKADSGVERDFNFIFRARNDRKNSAVSRLFSVKTFCLASSETVAVRFGDVAAYSSQVWRWMDAQRNVACFVCVVDWLVCARAAVMHLPGAAAPGCLVCDRTATACAWKVAAVTGDGHRYSEALMDDVVADRPR
jgi:hypothetical protein